MKKVKEKILNKQCIVHILLIVIGTILLLIPSFHSNIWFDESYSVGIVNHSFIDIWKIGAHDVHPILYYWMLKIVNIIFGTNIIAYRIFSVLGIVTLGILGMTHIRKDFGNKTGMLFTFFSMFLPTMLNYGLEIRMYSWTIVFVTLMAIYLYRFIKEKNTKNLILFGLFSIISCYMHYYALVCAGIVNLGLIIYIIKNRKKIDIKIIKQFILIEVIQVLLYIPWFIFFVKQAFRVGKGFWISITFPQILVDIINFQYKGKMQETIPTIFSCLLYGYLLYIIIKNIRRKVDIKEGIIPLIIYLLVIIMVAIVSIVSPILYARYLFTITGLLLFAISYFLNKEDNKFMIGLICGAVIIMSLNNLKIIMDKNYDKSNNKPISYIKEIIKPEDTIVYSKIGNGAIVATLVDNNNQYFLNLENWTVEEAYKAYGPNMKTVDSYEEAIKENKGRIIVVDTDDLPLYTKIENKEKYNEVERKRFETKYNDDIFQIIVLEEKK